MRAWDDIPRDVFDHWAQNYAELAPPNGETFGQLQQRGIAFVEDILQKHPQGHVLVVTHGGMIRAMLAHVLNMQLKGLFRFNIDYGSVTQLDFCGTVPKIEYVNR
jgi:alpha-ribazole phosphatase